MMIWNTQCNFAKFVFYRHGKGLVCMTDEKEDQYILQNPKRFLNKKKSLRINQSMF